MPTIPDLMARAVEGVFAINGEQRVIFWNQACEKLTGISATSAVGDSCQNVLKGRDTYGRPLCKANCPLCELSQGGPPPASLPMRITHANGNTLQVNVGTMLIPSSREPQWNIVHVLRRGRECRAPEGMCGCDKKLKETKTRTSEPSQPESGQMGASLLTSREREILRLLADGTGVGPMSNQLHISVVT